jgi:membrane protein DedA with SNARE-associated domain
VLSTLADGWTDASAIGYPAIFGGVLLGSVIPVLPTGAIVGAGAAVAMSSGQLSLPLVVLVSAAGALIGDLITFGAARFGHGTVARLLARGQHPERLETARRQFTEHGWLIVLVGRLLPAGRVPVLLAAGALHYPWRRMAAAAAGACLIWAVAYAALGALTGGLFDDPLVAPLLAAAVVIAVGGITSLVAARRRRTAVPPTVAPTVADTAPEAPAGPMKDTSP